MPSFQLVSQSDQDSDNRAANTSRLINCYLEPVGDKIVIKAVLGMVNFATLPSVFARAIEEIDGILYAVQGGTLYQIAEDGTATALSAESQDGKQPGVPTQIGIIPDDPETTISGNTGNVTVAAGGRYFVWDGESNEEPAAGAFSDFGSVSFFGALTVLTERNGQRIQWSDIRLPKTLNGLSFATANARDDNILRGMAIGGSFWVFKEESIERWYQNGADLAPVQGAAVDYGLKAFGLISKVPNGAFFVSSDNKVRMMSGSSGQPISNRGIETAIEQGDPTHCYFYQDEGHDMCVVRFSDRPAWCYDMATRLWHERAEGDLFDAWSAVGSAKAYGKWNLSTEAGTVYQVDRVNEDETGPLLRQVTSSTMQNDGQRFIIARLEAEGRVGHSQLGRDAQVMLEMSKDQGETWTAPKVRSMGAVGEYDKRMVWRQLGQFRNATARITISDPVELPISNEVYVDVV